MLVRSLILAAFSAVFSVGQEIPRAVQVVEPPKSIEIKGQERVISSSRKFTIRGGEAEDRASIAILAEEAQTELLELTDERAGIKDGVSIVPVNITLHGKPGDPLPRRTVAMEILARETGYELRIDVHLSAGIEKERFKYATTSALIYERSLRDQKARGQETPFVVPPWLVDGLQEATAWRLNQSDRRLYQALFKTSGLFKIDEIFTLNEPAHENLDGAMRAAFRVSSGALVMALLEQPQGKEGFRNFLKEVAAFEGEMPALLRKHFPELNLSETSLSKWWALQIANIGGQNLLTDILTISQTETALSEALRLNLKTAEGIVEPKEISAWPELAALSEQERAKAVQLAQDSLVRLSYRCFPSYRPILSEYQIAFLAMVKNKPDNLASQLADLDERRATMSAKAIRARDYLDWFEISRARETSGVFDDYIRLKERLKANPHRRDDHVSKYLDQMDEIFSREGDLKTAPTVTPFDASPLPELIDLPPLAR